MAISVSGGIRHTREVAVLENSFAGLTLGSTISQADLVTALGGSVPDNATMRGRIAVTDFGAPYGRGLAITLPDSADGVVYQPALSTPFDEGYVEYDARWRSPFPWGKGGKMPGLAGKDDQIANPPSGSSPSPHGWGGRSMWLEDASGGQVPNAVEWVGYKYWPGQTTGTSGSNLSTGVNLGAQGGTSDGTWRRFRKYYRMNASTVTDTTIDPATLVQGTHYQNDGLWEEWVDGTRVGNFTNQVLRYYEPAKCTHLQFSFFYGGDATWSGGGGTIDIARLRIVKVR